MSTLICVRPISNTGPGGLWTREARDAERAVDTLRCLCGGPRCRDAEIPSTPSRPRDGTHS